MGGHCLSLYLTVISTLGIVHKTAGYSFPLLPSALQGGLQCGWGGGSDNSQHVYTGPKKKKKRKKNLSWYSVEVCKGLKIQEGRQGAAFIWTSADEEKKKATHNRPQQGSPSFLHGWV